MDDIKIWLYLGFGLIYFIVKQMGKKKSAEDASPEEVQEMQRPQRKPMTFDELLREFTQEKSMEEREVLVDDYAEEQQQKAIIEEIKPVPKSDELQRHFADEESRKVYENSIKQAEGFDLKFEKDEHFKTKVKSKSNEEEVENSFLNEILESFQDPNQAKKAVVISEILNKRY